MKTQERYDLIFDLVANHSLLAFRQILSRKGIYIGAGIGPGGSITGFLARAAVTAPVLSRVVSQKFVTFIAKITKEDLTVMREFILAGRVKPIVEKLYGLSEVPEAIRYLSTFTLTAFRPPCVRAKKWRPQSTALTCSVQPRSRSQALPLATIRCKPTTTRQMEPLWNTTPQTTGSTSRRLRVGCALRKRL